MTTKKSVKKMYCRMFQSVMKAGISTIPWRTPKLMKGAGAVRHLPAAIKRRGLEKALIVTGPTLIGRGLLDGVLEEMEEQGLLYVIYNKVEQNPTDENVEDAVKVFLENGCDCMLALGGGAPLDCAKAVGARIARPNRQIRQLQGLFRVVKQIPMLFAVPTTAGSGSETTISAVITDTATHHKAAINDLRLMPKYAVLDPELTLGLPPDVTAMKEFGRIDILVNNAGITKDGLLMKMSEDDFDAVVDTNLKGAFHCIRFVSRAMIRQRSGRIINISSVSGVLGNAGQANYAASKAGVIGLTKSAARELAGRKITVNAVAPGFIRTEMTAVLSEKVKEKAVLQIPMERFGEAEDVAQAVAFLASEQAGYITGQVLCVDGGMAM